jgi:transposase InsO family protein
MGDNYKTPLIKAAIDMAARNHQLAQDAIFHSDRGSNPNTPRRARARRQNERVAARTDRVAGSAERVHRGYRAALSISSEAAAHKFLVSWSTIYQP